MHYKLYNDGSVVVFLKQFWEDFVSWQIFKNIEEKMLYRMQSYAFKHNLKGLYLRYVSNISNCNFIVTLQFLLSIISP